MRWAMAKVVHVYPDIKNSTLTSACLPNLHDQETSCICRSLASAWSTGAKQKVPSLGDAGADGGVGSRQDRVNGLSSCESARASRRRYTNGKHSLCFKNPTRRNSKRVSEPRSIFNSSAGLGMAVE